MNSSRADRLSAVEAGFRSLPQRYLGAEPGFDATWRIVLGDIGHTGVFDTAKIRRFVPGFAPRLTFHRAARRMVQWRTDHPDTTAADPTTEAVLDRIVDAYHAAREVFAERAPQPSGVGG